MQRAKTNQPKRITDLTDKFQSNGKYHKFGEFLQKIQVFGIKSLENIILEFDFPIVAICGKNGIGKSTLLKVISVAYQDGYSLGDHFKKSPLDENLFSESPVVYFEYLNADGNNQELTLGRNTTGGGWYGYKRRPSRKILYINLDFPDFSVRKLINQRFENKDFEGDAETDIDIQITLNNSKSFDNDSKRWINRILTKSYQKITEHNAAYGDQKLSIDSVEIDNISYSELHMGDGEFRVLAMLKAIQSLPDKSLILLEEPEVCLHPLAQYNLGCYLTNICLNKGHQIILTTHSQSLLSTLPRKAIIFMKSSGEIKKNISIPEVLSLISDGHQKNLIIFVEDKRYLVGEEIVRAIIRRIDRDFLDTVLVKSVGDWKIVKTLCDKLMEIKEVRCCGVVDADQKLSEEDIKKNIFTLPSKFCKSPEEDMFMCPEIEAFLLSTYEIKWKEFYDSNLHDVDHHAWITKLAQRIAKSEDSFRTELCEEYVKYFPETELQALVDQFKESCL